MVLVFGRQFFINAWKQAKHRSANMDTLVALSTGVAYRLQRLQHRCTRRSGPLAD